MGGFLCVHGSNGSWRGSSNSTFRDIEARFRDRTGQLACGANHERRCRSGRFIDAGELGQFLNDLKCGTEAEIASSRERAEVARLVSEASPGTPRIRRMREVDD